MSFPLRTSLALALPFLACLPTLFSVAGCNTAAHCALNDNDCDEVPDDIGAAMYGTSGQWLKADTDADGIGDGYAIDENGDGVADGVAIDVNDDGYYDGIDRNGDGVADRVTGDPPVGGSGGAPPGSGGSPGGGGTPPGTGGGSSGGAPPGTGGSTPNTSGSCLTATPVHSGSATVTAQYVTIDTWRQNCSDVGTCPAVQYKFISNGWGVNWQSHTLTYGGTKLSVDAFSGSTGLPPDHEGEPAGYPTVFCGLYAGNIQSGECGLPAPIASLAEIDTGVKWTAGTQGSNYNVAYDIWMGNGNTLSSYLMVWLRDPPNAQPAGSLRAGNVYVGDDPARWDVWAGTVTVEGVTRPIVNYVRPVGEESNELAFDAMDFLNHAKSNNYNLPGDTVLSVAVGFEIWDGPVAGLKVDDFCVEVH